jgi:hypothetical protein
MPRLPARFATIILSFASLFRYRSWRYAEVLLIGAMLAPGKRTVTSLLRIMGLSRERRFVNYHRVLNRARWSEREAARLLLRLLLIAFVPCGPVMLGLDNTIERRRGKRIAAQGIYREPGGEARSGALREQVDDAMQVQIHQDGAVSLPFVPSPIIDPQVANGGHRYFL